MIAKYNRIELLGGRGWHRYYILYYYDDLLFKKKTYDYKKQIITISVEPYL